MTGLAPGPHEIVLDAPSGAHQKIAFDSGPSSRLLASFSTDREVGVLRIVADDGATVYLNGEKYRRTTSNGRLLVYLTPKQYTVRVEKEGFATPPEQVATLKLGEEAKLEFKLLPARASLSVRNSVPGAEVWLDGARLGAVRPDGSFSSDVDPGKHVIILKSESLQTAPGRTAVRGGKAGRSGRQARVGVRNIEDRDQSARKRDTAAPAPTGRAGSRDRRNYLEPSRGRLHDHGFHAAISGRLGRRSGNRQPGRDGVSRSETGGEGTGTSRRRGRGPSRWRIGKGPAAGHATGPI